MTCVVETPASFFLLARRRRPNSRKLVKLVNVRLKAMPYYTYIRRNDLQWIPYPVMSDGVPKPINLMKYTSVDQSTKSPTPTQCLCTKIISQYILFWYERESLEIQRCNRLSACFFRFLVTAWDNLVFAALDSSLRERSCGFTGTVLGKV